MKQTFLSILLMLLPMLASADAVEIGGIWYNLVAKIKEAEVTSNPNKYSGNVVIPPSVTYNGEPYSVTSIGSNAFGYCSNLTSITIPNSVTSIGEAVFRGCSSLTSITIPNNVKTIGDRAFQYCSNLTSISIPNSMTEIGAAVFHDCRNLTSITIPNSVTSIGGSAFSGCSGLISITIPNSVTSIGDRVFDGCTSLTSITIPNSVTSISGSLFYKCSNLSSVTISNRLNKIENYFFFGCSSLTSITIPNGVTSIGDAAFSSCSGLNSITIPNGVTSIGKNAFSYCSGLTSITIPNSVTSIGYETFSACPDLTDVICLAENVPATSYDAFNGSYIEYATLHVPAAAVDAYKSTAPWSNFKSFVAVDGSEIPETPKCATPTITYKNGKINFSCETEGVEYFSTITAGDTKSFFTGEITLTNKYTVSVYATKDGYDKSDTATLDIIGSAGAFGDLNEDGEVNVADHVELTKIIMNQSK